MPERRVSRPSRRRLLAAVVATVVLVDQVTKALAVHFLAGRGYVHVVGSLHLTLYRNFAGSANRFTGHPVLVSLLALAAVLLIGSFALRVRSRVSAIAAGLLLGGGISNLLDRLLRAPGPLRGGVVDWIKPTLSGGTMNLADVAISAGVALFLVAAVVEEVRHWLGRRPGRTPPPPAETLG
jgi:signal peptidase II